MNYGFEIELFGADLQKKQIFSANNLITDYLKLKELPGHSANQNPILASNNRLQLIADGTPFEIIGKQTACEESMLGKDGYAVKFINTDLKQIRSYLEKLFNIDTLLTPFVEKPEWEFINPGQVYSSGKRKHNAYTNTSKYDDKKKEKSRNLQKSLKTLD